ncbi:uncharacterized protein [Rhodnius prolixus]|uniref:uncharacterized protein n=1 Tax=Rhodnius prolixus TaxID=13249 RepID=UPI003D18A396
MGTNDSNDKFEILLGEIGQINQILNTIQQRFSELKIENQGLSTSISSLKTEIKSDFSSLKNDLKILNVKSDKLRKENVMFEKKLIYFNSLMVDYEQFRYGNRVRLTNIPYSENENLLCIIKAIGEFIGCSIDGNDSDFFYRLKRKSFTPNPPIILKFVRRDMKNNFFKLFWVKKELINIEILSGISEATLKRIYISDDMGPETYRLFSKAKELQKSGKVKYCWSRNGKILIRKEEGLKVVLIKSESDLMKFGYEVPVDLEDGSSLATGEDTETEDVLTSQGIDRSAKKRKLNKSQSGRILGFLKPRVPPLTATSCAQDLSTPPPKK